jgi:hypothetical protein
VFDSINSLPHPPVVLEHIERIQRDFLAMAGPEVPDAMEEIVARSMAASAKTNPPWAMEIFESLNLTKYQNPLYQREIAVASKFVVDCFNQYEPPEGISLESESLEVIPFATVLAPALTGFVYDMDIDMAAIGQGKVKVPCIFLSQHCTQTAWICSYVHRLAKEMATEQAWERCIERQEIDIPTVPEVVVSIVQETMKAFFCDQGASEAGYYFDSAPENIEAGRLLLSFLLAHEYSHICLRHRARRNDDSPLALSSFRLRDLSEITEDLSQEQRLRVPVSTDRLRYFFGYQQDELEADLLAFWVLYSGIRSQDRCEELLPVFFRQVCYSILWCEINEVFGRICLNGTEWIVEPLHNPDHCSLSDIAWRNRYPSAHSRVGYLYDRAKVALTDEHLKVFETELHETAMLFSVWRGFLVKGADAFASLFKVDDPDTQGFRDSFVWKGMPQSVKGSVGYNDPTDGFRVYRWQDYTQV